MHSAGRTARWAGASIGAAVVVGATWALPLVMMTLIVPKFEEIFRDFGVALPGVTVWVIRASRWLAGNQVGQVVPGIVIVAPVFLIVLVAVCALAVRARSWLALAALVLPPLAAMPVIIVAMFVPLVAMIESLQGGGP